MAPSWKFQVLNWSPYSLATNQILPKLTFHTNAALNIGLKSIKILDLFINVAPFIDFLQVLNAIEVIGKVFEQRTLKSYGKPKHHHGC